MARAEKNKAGSFVCTDNAIGHSMSSSASCRVLPSGSKLSATMAGAIAYLTNNWSATQNNIRSDTLALTVTCNDTVRRLPGDRQSREWIALRSDGQPKRRIRKQISVQQGSSELSLTSRCSSIYPGLASFVGLLIHNPCAWVSTGSSRALVRKFLDPSNSYAMRLTRRFLEDTSRIVEDYRWS